MKRFITKWKAGLNFTYTFATGRPYYNFIVNNTGKYVTADEGHTKDYQNLSFSCEYVPSLGEVNPKTLIVLFASMSNVLGYNPIYGYHYSFDGTIKQPIRTPAIGFYFMRCF